MKLTDYLDAMEPRARKEFALRCGTKISYLNLIRCDVKKPSPRLAKRIHEESNTMVSLESMRPDIWGTGKGSRHVA